jgi:uncharacterized protein YqgV (UPF0045/DUF77 family)
MMLSRIVRFIVVSFRGWLGLPVVENDSVSRYVDLALDHVDHFEVKFD